MHVGLDMISVFIEATKLFGAHILYYIKDKQQFNKILNLNSPDSFVNSENNIE